MKKKTKISRIPEHCIEGAAVPTKTDGTDDTDKYFYWKYFRWTIFFNNNHLIGIENHMEFLQDISSWELLIYNDTNFTHDDIVDV